MRVLAIGDIHGCYTAFDHLLSIVQPQAEDVVVTLGDYVDRGPDSRSVIERLLELRRSVQLKPLRGNHEIMMLHARHDEQTLEAWLGFGGEETLASYGGSGSFEDVPQGHWDFMENQCLDWWETPTHFFVHANAHPKVPLEEQTEHTLFWVKFGHPARHISGKIMVCGHTAQKSGLPYNLGHAVCIDTWAYGKGWLTCLDTGSGQIWQANQAGKERSFALERV